MVQSHLALAVPDLPPEILEKLSSKDLSNMAQTCKDWTELASERRWRTARTKLSQLLPSLARSLTRVMELNMIATQDRSTHFEENYSHKAAWMELDIAPGLESLCAVAKPYERSGRRLFRRLSHVDATEFTRDLEVHLQNYMCPGTGNSVEKTLRIRVPRIQRLTVRGVSSDY
ncbi:hypothetical protein FRB96_002366 [Tulasnella sp. 330]|nr:hypothetical protein FRB96_002366 [Tulasnella sp. 330]